MHNSTTVAAPPATGRFPSLTSSTFSLPSGALQQHCDVPPLHLILEYSGSARSSPAWATFGAVAAKCLVHLARADGDAGGLGAAVADHLHELWRRHLVLRVSLFVHLVRELRRCGAVLVVLVAVLPLVLVLARSFRNSPYVLLHVDAEYGGDLAGERHVFEEE